MSESEPIIRLDPAGRAPVLSYSVPESTSYQGRHYIELSLPAEYFERTGSTSPAAPIESIDSSLSSLTERLERFAEGTVRDPSLEDMLGPAAEDLARPAPLATFLDASTPEYSEIARGLLRGEAVATYLNLAGEPEVQTYPPPRGGPRLMIVESYRLSSYRGNYGAGEVIKTFSLLPGEKTKISVRTYRKTDSTRKGSSSIFDSFGRESAKSFEDSLRSEQSDKKNYKQSFGYHVGASAEANFGVAKIGVSAGVKGSSNSARDQLARNTSNAVNRHAAKASSKRSVQVNTSFEVKEQTGEETEIVREIENVNLSRTLSFVFRQMNQEYISILHLVDARVAYVDSSGRNYREVPLSELDGLLAEVVSSSHRSEVKDVILDELRYISDYRDGLKSFVEEKALQDEQGRVLHRYWRTKRGDNDTYSSDGHTIKVPGIILTVTKNTLRTDGVIVDAILGQGPALDAYSEGLQTQTVVAKSVENEHRKLLNEREKLGQEIVRSADRNRSKLYEEVFPEPELETHHHHESADDDVD